jgi:glycosyltransferase involved in cell wall biosynthesis
MFGWEFPPNISGGLGTACLGIVKGMSAYPDVHITFVVPKTYGNEQSSGTVQLISAEEVPVRSKYIVSNRPASASYLEVSSKLVPYLTPQSFASKYQVSETQNEYRDVARKNITIPFTGKYGSTLFDEINNYAIVAQSIARKNQFNLIHAHDWLTFPAAVAARQISGKPLVLHVHSTDFDRSGGNINPSIYAIEKQGFEKADHIITVSNRVKARLIEQYSIPPEKITTVYNAIDNESDCINLYKKRSGKEKIVTYLGRITIQKGPEYFVEVARLVLRRMRNVHFVMAGDGELTRRMIDLCVRYGISDRFHFTGFLKGKEVNEMLNQSDLFIMPSVSEPFGIVPLEAMQANVPVIISLQSGVSELIHHAIKTDFWDVHAIADAVHRILKNKALSKILSFEGKKEVSKLSWEFSARQIRQVYFNTLAQQAS